MHVYNSSDFLPSHKLLMNYVVIWK